MFVRRFPLPLLSLLGACSVDSTVGFNDGALAGGLACRGDELARCDGGACALTQVFDAPRGSITLAVDDANVFFLAAPNTIARRSLGGGESVELARAESALIRMTSDATHVYWTELDGNVRGVSKAGGPRFDAGYVFGNPSDIALDSSHLYWIFPEFGQVASAPKPSGEATHITGQDSPQAITTDATYVWWVNAGTGALTGELVRARRGDLASAEVVLSGLDAPIAVATSGDAVYWASKTAVFRLPKGEVEAQTIATGFNEVKGIGVAGGAVYGVGMEGLWQVPARGGDWTQLERRAMSGMAVACAGVYATGWFENGLVKYGP